MRELTQQEAELINGGLLGLKISTDLGISSILGQLTSSFDLCLTIGRNDDFCGCEQETPAQPPLA